MKPKPSHPWRKFPCFVPSKKLERDYFQYFSDSVYLHIKHKKKFNRKIFA
jgi:hypothetical protein